MLLYLDYDFYHSSVPSSFIRSTRCLVTSGSSESSSSPSVKRSYQQHEYFNVIITSKIRDGATGIIHRGILRATVKGDETLERTVVVKFAFLEDQQRRLRHEYEAYRRLAAHGVTGVLEVYGIFEDRGGSSRARYGHCSTTLCELKPEMARIDPILTPAQRCVYPFSISEIGLSESLKVFTKPVIGTVIFGQRT